MESICNPCERRNVVSKLTHWCSDCEDGLCEKCLKDHKAMKLTQHHHVTEMTEMSVEKIKHLSIPQCEKHPDCREDFVCLDHDLICCHACLKTEHKDCKNVSNVNVLSKGVKKSEMFLSNKQTIQEIRETIKRIIEERQSVKEGVTKQQQRIRMEIANTKSKFMEHINNLEKILLQELTNIEKENKSFIEEEMSELLKTDKKVDEEEKKMQFIADTASESQLFTFLKKQKRKQDEIMKMLEDIPPTSRVKISLVEASHGIKAIKAIGFLSVHYEIIESETLVNRSTIKKDLDKAPKAVSVQSNKVTITPSGNIRRFPIMEDTLQIQLDPRDFIDRDEKYAKLNLLKVWIAVRDDNCLLIAGHVQILEEHTEEGKSSKYKNNYRLVKYVYDEKVLTFINGCNIYCDQYKESAYECYPMSMQFNCIPQPEEYLYNTPVFESRSIVICIALNCIPNSTQVVLLHGTSFELMDTESMQSQWCLQLDHQFQAIATNEKFIYIANNGYLYKYNLIGCLMTQIKFIHCSSFALTLNGNFACHSGNFRLLRGNGTEIFSYHPAGLKTVTADNAGNIYLATRDGIQLLDPFRMETAMVYRYDKEMYDGLMEVLCNRDKQLLFLQKKESQKGGEFGQFVYSGEIQNNFVDFWEFSIHVLTKSEK